MNIERFRKMLKKRLRLGGLSANAGSYAVIVLDKNATFHTTSSKPTTHTTASSCTVA